MRKTACLPSQRTVHTQNSHNYKRKKLKSIFIKKQSKIDPKITIATTTTTIIITRTVKTQ